MHKLVKALPVRDPKHEDQYQIASNADLNSKEHHDLAKDPWIKDDVALKLAQRHGPNSAVHTALASNKKVGDDVKQHIASVSPAGSRPWSNLQSNPMKNGKITPNLAVHPDDAPGALDAHQAKVSAGYAKQRADDNAIMDYGHAKAPAPEAWRAASKMAVAPAAPVAAAPAPTAAPAPSNGARDRMQSPNPWAQLKSLKNK